MGVQVKGAKAKPKRTISDVAADKSVTAKGAKENEALIAQLQAEVKRLRDSKKRKHVTVKRGKATKHITRVIIPDSHGEHIDLGARAAFLADLKQLAPDEIVGLGDHLDCAGTFSTHQRSYTNELAESYDADVSACNSFLDDCQENAPDATWDYIEGNHCAHVGRWVSRNFTSRRDADMILELIGPEGVLRLKQRGMRFIKRSEVYDGLALHGTIRKGRCFFVHGVSHAKNADSVHLERFGASVVFGHTHRAMSVVSRTVTSQGHGAWCPGTLAKLQPLYAHTHPTSWSHGYALQLVNQSTGTFLHLNIPILDGVSMLREVTALGRSA